MWFKTKEKEEENGLFTKTWMEDWFESINNSKEFKQKGKTWNAPLIIKFEPLPDLLINNNATGIYLELKYGECKEVRYSTKGDEDICDVILSADEQTWIQLMEKGADPTSMILNNRLSLEKGSLILLSTQSKAAKTLLKTAPTATIESNSNTENIKVKSRTHFQTTNIGLNEKSLPIKLFRSGKAEKLLTANFDASIELKDWKELNEVEQIFITHLMSLLLATKEASSIYHLPLMQVISEKGRFEEHMYMTSMLWDESTHLDFLSGYTKRVMGSSPDFENFHGEHFKSLLYNKLPQTVSELKTDPTPVSQIKTSATLSFIIKSMIAKSCYTVLNNFLGEQNILPGLKKGLTNIIQDESAHQTFSIYFMKGLLNENKFPNEIFEKELNELLYDGTNIIQEIFTFYENESLLAINKESMLSNAIEEYQNCVSAIRYG